MSSGAHMKIEYVSASDSRSTAKMNAEQHDDADCGARQVPVPARGPEPMPATRG